MRFIWVLGALVFATAEVAAGQGTAESFSLTVRVLSETGEPLSSGSVAVARLEGEPENRQEVALTGLGDGVVVVNVPGKGRYRITIRARGHEDRVETVAIAGPRVLRIVLTLDPYVLPPIVASGSGPAPATAVRSVDRVSFEGQTLAYATVSEWLSDVPGVSVRGRGTGGRQVLSVRGSRPQDVLVLLDGVTLNDPLTGAADLAGLPTATLQAATLVRGTASRSYGSGASAATLLLTSRDVEGTGIGGGLRWGSFGSVGMDLQADAGIGGTRLGASVSIDRAENDFAYRGPGGGEATESRVNADTRGVHGTIRASAGAFQGNLRFDRSEHGLPGRIGTSLFDSARAEDRSWVGSIGYQHPAVRASASFARRLMSYRQSVAAAPSSQRIHEWRLSGEATLPGAPVTVGGRLSSESFSGDAVEGTPNRISPGIGIGAGLSAGSFRMDPGIAADLSVGRVILSPEMTLTWLPSTAARGWARLGQGFRSPTFGDLHFQSLYRVRANPELLPERITIDGEVGFSARLPLGHLVGSGSLAGWTRTTKDPIVWIPSSVAVWSPRNLGSLAATGLDVEIGVETREVARWGFRARLAGAWQRSRVGFGSNRNRLPYQPDVSGQLSLGVWTGNIGMGVSLRYTGSRTTSLAATRVLEGFLTTDVSAHHYLDAGRFTLGFFARIENLWDREYQLTELFPEPGRRFSLRLEARKARP